MPAYNTQVPPPAIAPGDTVQPMNGSEAGAALQAGGYVSQQVACTRAQGVGRGLIAQGLFGGTPGTFEVDIQGSEVDSPSQYATLPNGSITTADANNPNAFRAEFSGSVPKFARALVKTLTNAVTLTLNISEF